MSDQYTPTTGQVREAWVEFARFRLNVTTEFLHGCFGLSRSGHEAVFGRWLASVKAEAWDEGHHAGRLNETYRDHTRNFWRTPPTNPYREQETP